MAGLSIIDIGKDLTTFGQAVLALMILAGGLGLMAITTFCRALWCGTALRRRLDRGQALDEFGVGVGRTFRGIALTATLVILLGAVVPVTSASMTFPTTANVSGPPCSTASRPTTMPGSASGRQPRALPQQWCGECRGDAADCHRWPRLAGDQRSEHPTPAQRTRTTSPEPALPPGAAHHPAPDRFGAGGLALTEWLNQGDLAGMPWPERWLTALFQSVTARTAGFTTVPSLDTVTESSLLLLMVLMFIGASPGGTGGGIKTTTVAAALMAATRPPCGGGRRW